MLIFVHGEDGFRVREKVGELRARFHEKFDASRLNAEEFGADAEAGRVAQAAAAPPFLGARRMVIVREAIGRTKAAEAEAWEAALARVAGSDAIVVFADQLAAAEIAKKPLFKKLKPLGETHVYDFPLLEGTALETWVAARAKAMNVLLGKEELRALTSRVGGDLWQMQNELEKLSARSAGSPVSLAMIDELVRASFDDRMFAFIDALSSRDAKTALRLLEEERLSGASDQQIFAMIARQIRILLGTRALLDMNATTKDAVAKELSVHPFVAQKALGFCRRFTYDQLRSAHARSFDLDVAMKSGGTSAELALERTIAGLLA